MADVVVAVVIAASAVEVGIVAVAGRRTVTGREDLERRRTLAGMGSAVLMMEGRKRV